LGDEINVDKKLVTCRETRGENIKNRSHFLLDIFLFLNFPAELFDIPITRVSYYSFASSSRRLSPK
jgi:hypothetical protein